MGYLNRMGESAAEFVHGLRDVRDEVRETAGGIVAFLRHRFKEKKELALARRENGPRIIRSDRMDFGNGAEVFQIDEDTISVGGEELYRGALANSSTTLNITQHDLNLDFLPFGWSCRLGNGVNTFFVAAYEGRDDGNYRGQRVLVVKNCKDQIIKIIKPTAKSTQGVLLEKGLVIQKINPDACMAGDRKITHRQLMDWIQPGTRMSDDASGITIGEILAENNKLDWSCDLGTGDEAITLTAYESKDARKRRILVITDAHGNVRGEVFPFHLRS